MENKTNTSKPTQKELEQQIRKSIYSIKKLTYVNDSVLETLKTNKKKVLQKEVDDLSKLVNQF
jgi:hypothetical protein